MGVDEPPCCDYRDHGRGWCACPEHDVSALHPYGADREYMQALMRGDKFDGR